MKPPNFKYRPLKTNTGEIRLLTFDTRALRSGFHCELKHVPLDKAPAYSALSYSWELETLGKMLIYINGRPHEIYRNLYDALHNLRDIDPSIRFWADAICINQDNLVERGQQVQLMQKIFSRAEKTLIWLGVEKDNSSRAFDLIETCSAHFFLYPPNSFTTSFDFDYGESGPPSSWLTSEELEALEHLLRRSWWYRVWIVQEVAVSESVAVYCGRRSCPWDVLGNAADILIRDRYRLRDKIIKRIGDKGALRFTNGLDRILSIDATYYTFHIDMQAGKESPRSGKNSPRSGKNSPRSGKNSPRSGKNSPRSLFHLLSNHSPADATDPRDKCIALAGLAYRGVFPLEVEVYNQSVKHIYTTATRSIVREEKEGRLKFLEYSGQSYQRSDLQSWVPDWAYNGERPKQLLHRQLEREQVLKLIPYSAAGSDTTSENNTTIRKDDTLSAYGFIFDFVDGISACDCNILGDSAPHTEEEDKQICQPKYISQRRSDGNFDSIRDELWRTLVLNRDDKQRRPPENWGHLLYTTLSLLVKTVDNGTLDNDSHFLKKWYDRNKSFQICGSTTLEDILREWEDCNSNLPLLEDSMMKEIRALIYIVTNLKNLSNTRKGHLALMPVGTQHGDTIAILYDCDLPVVLRPRQTHYTFIGCCYVHGIMEGEAMAGVETGEFTARTFDIR